MQQQGESEREELKNALIAAQESAAVQILLECCLPRGEEEQVSVTNIDTDYSYLLLS